MTTRFDCTLEGVRLSGIDESICIHDIREDAPKLRSASAPMPGGGVHLLQRERESLSVQVTFSIQEPDILRRGTVFSAVLAWAEAGGLFCYSARPGQQLRVMCTALPTLNTDDWTQPLTLTFTSTLAPWWEDTEVTTVTLAESTILTVPGNAGDAPVSAVVINQGDEAVTHLTLRCGDTQMIFDGLTLPAGGILFLTEPESGLSVQVDNQSVLLFRTPESDDHLLAPCGNACEITVEADQPLDAAFSARGRYL